MNQEIEPLKYRAIQFGEQARVVAVNSQETLEQANTLRKAAKSIIKMIDDFFSPMKTKAKEALDEVTRRWRECRDPVMQADLLLKSGMDSYAARIERERREALEKQRAEEEEARQKAEEEAKRKAEEEARLQAALKAEQEGHNEEAEKMLEEAIKNLPPPLPIEVVEKFPVEIPPEPKAEGLHTRHDWKWRVVDEGAVPRSFLMIDAAKITRHVKEHKGETQIPGIEAYIETSVVTR